MTPAGTCEEGVANEDAPRSVLEEEFEKGAGEELEDLASVALLAIEWADEDEELDSVPLARGCDRGADADEEVDSVPLARESKRVDEDEAVDSVPQARECDTGEDEEEQEVAFPNSA